VSLLASELDTDLQANNLASRQKELEDRERELANKENDWLRSSFRSWLSRAKTRGVVGSSGYQSTESLGFSGPDRDRAGAPWLQPTPLRGTGTGGKHRAPTA
jgi:hypothetical protein